MKLRKIYSPQSTSNKETSLNKVKSEKISIRKKIRRVILRGIMNYSLLLGLIFGIVIIILGVFEPLFLPVNLFLIMMGLIYVLFNDKSREEMFQEFVMMVGSVGFIALLLTYIINTVQFTPLSMEGVQTVFMNLQYLLSIFVSLFAAPCIYSSFRLLFYPKKNK
ncbi:MAG: hypothetical protein ACMXYB_04440 [Candidatus Woesearchaeota archaeon]